VLLLGAVGLVWGFAADRIAARWPAHDDGSIGRSTAHADRHGRRLSPCGHCQHARSRAVLLFAAVSRSALVATDLDQRLLPDVITTDDPDRPGRRGPGWDPLVAGQLPSAIVAAIAVPAILFALSIHSARGDRDRRHQAAGQRQLLTGLGQAVLGSSPPRSCRA
jgi:hypothetical protein